MPIIDKRVLIFFFLAGDISDGIIFNPPFSEKKLFKTPA
ncbi:hypothetical protein D1AOALGA4SA_1818 [Olavius algarvensis Delta 1 endosymbiont]|nr:hypothetical protein D1AOALGA4SA_1818 [Olavius algarvensis Delta 1 endosymbiont]